MDDEEMRRITGDAATRLMEHFDNVQIFVSKKANDGLTYSCCFGSGNWFARVGQVGEWLEIVREGARERARGDGE